VEESRLDISEVILPCPGKSIFQDTISQGVSLASELLYQTTLQLIPDRPLEVLELGSGCGIVSIMCALYRPSWRITGIEIQPALVDLARANASRCAVDIAFVTQDLRIHEGEYDLILANPPWLEVHCNRLSPHSSRNLSKFELSCTITDIADTIRRCLRPGGQALLIYPQHRISGLLKALKKTFLDINIVRSHCGKKAFFIYRIRHQDKG